MARKITAVQVLQSRARAAARVKTVALAIVKKKRKSVIPKIGKNIFGLSEIVTVPMNYSQVYNFTAGTLGQFGTENLWNLNSTFDIDNTAPVTSHQPYLRDQYAALYAKYKVISIKMQVTCSDPSADGMVIGFSLTPPASTTTLAGFSPTVCTERPDTWMKYLNNTGKQVVVFQRTSNIYSLSGISKLQFDADISQYNQNVGGNPAAIPKLRVAVANLDGSSTANSVKMIFKFTQYVKWYDRVTQGPS